MSVQLKLDNIPKVPLKPILSGPGVRDGSCLILSLFGLLVTNEAR